MYIFGINGAEHGVGIRSRQDPGRLEGMGRMGHYTEAVQRPRSEVHEALTAKSAQAACRTGCIVRVGRQTLSQNETEIKDPTNGPGNSGGGAHLLAMTCRCGCVTLGLACRK